MMIVAMVVIMISVVAMILVASMAVRFAFVMGVICIGAVIVTMIVGASTPSKRQTPYAKRKTRSDGIIRFIESLLKSSELVMPLFGRCCDSISVFYQKRPRFLFSKARV